MSEPYDSYPESMGGQVDKEPVGDFLSVISDNLIIQALQAEVNRLQHENQRLDDELVELRADHDTVAIGLSSLINKILSSDIDPISGLFSKATFDKLLDREIDRQRQQESEGGKLIIGIFDLDKFKSVNDKYGHGRGDDLLKIVADTLKEASRPGDPVFRIGGDEFAVIQNEVDIADHEFEGYKFAVIDRYKDAVNANILAAGFPDSLGLGVSVGIGLFEKGETKSELVYRIDQEMYKDKRARGVER